MTTVTEADPGATSIDERAAYATPRVVPSSEGRPVIVWEDRRATPRRDMTARVVLRHGERISVGVSENVSEGGIFVASFETYPPGTELDLVFSVPGVGAPEIAVRASVCRTREPRGRVAEVMPGMGMRFVDLDDDGRAAIAAYVETSGGRGRRGR
ncbi:MAG: PilZ domain-containing protein [Myxococcales bacterium]|nr:PilZ domain-containing protein [Myxococcales bacterium]MCB9736938.1 PilZ domain-containing protein [Deltaproteobacteria bacterium]